MIDEIDKYYEHEKDREASKRVMEYDAQKVMIMRDVFFNQDDFVFVFPEIREIRDIRFYN